MTAAIQAICAHLLREEKIAPDFEKHLLLREEEYPTGLKLGKINVAIPHGRVHKPMAKVLAKALEPYHPMFLEEVVLPENWEAFEQIAREVSVPLATGERLYTRWEFKSLFDQGAIDIIQPDVALCGGILEARKICAMAEAYDMT